MLGIEFLWGGPVKLETTEIEVKEHTSTWARFYYTVQAAKRGKTPDVERQYKRILYTMEKRKLSRTVL